jgi:serine/threonine protein phosphatase PrpC
MMLVRDVIATAGAVSANEDRAGHAGGLAWVIDGATDLYGDTATPAASDVQWLVDTVAERLRLAGWNGYDGSASSLLDEIARYVCDQMAALDFPTDRVPPACSLAVVADHGESYEITRIGDATAVIAGAQPALLATDFFDRREADAVAAQRSGVVPDDVTAGKHQRRLETMTAGGAESIFSGHPDRVLRSHTLVGEWRRTSAALMCTDGFARLITDHSLYAGWNDVIANALDKGLAYLEKMLRDAEADPASVQLGRFKQADDAAAVLLTPSTGPAA